MEKGKIAHLSSDLGGGFIKAEEGGDLVWFTEHSLKDIEFSELKKNMMVLFAADTVAGVRIAHTVTRTQNKSAAIAAYSDAVKRGWKNGSVVFASDKGGILRGEGGATVLINDGVETTEEVRALANQTVRYQDRKIAGTNVRLATKLKVDK